MKRSVCMAVYNGERFLEQQIRSILEQLGADDELIAVDDASTDCSATILAQITDPRLRILKNGSNRGVLETFERALHAATGDLIFLSDQDDLWRPGKVERIERAFADQPDLTLIVSDARIMDERGAVTSDSFFARRGRFRPGVLHNLMKNKYLGCTMAFRRSMLRIFLPIPLNAPMHDMWFGLLNQIYGRSGYIDEPLIDYRRHGGNASPLDGAPWPRRLRWRCDLLKETLLRCATLLRKTLPKGLYIRALYKKIRWEASKYRVFEGLFLLFRERYVTPRSDLVIEGFPRSGNSFARWAFITAQKRRVEVADHFHSIGHIQRGLRLGRPVLILIRDPLEAIASFLVHQQGRYSVRQALREYVELYRFVATKQNELIIASFEEVVSDFGAVINRINRRFGTDFERFEHTPENVQRCFLIMERRSRARSRSAAQHRAQVCRPLPGRDDEKRIMQNQLREASLADRLQAAKQVYNEVRSCIG